MERNTTRIGNLWIGFLQINPNNKRLFDVLVKEELPERYILFYKQIPIGFFTFSTIGRISRIRNMPFLHVKGHYLQYVFLPYSSYLRY